MGRFRSFLEKYRTSTAVGGIVALSAALFLWRRARPSNRRRWVREQENLSTAEVAGDKIAVRNVRCFRWDKDKVPEPAYEDRVYDLSELKTLDYIITRFGMKGLAAHTMLSFGFADGRHVVASVECRRREGQHFSILQGLLRSYELQYIFADERDILALRTNVRDEPTCLFPVATSPEKLRRLLVSIIERANRLAEKPEFYHSVANTCTTNLIYHFNQAGMCRTPSRTPRSVFSGLSDGLLHKLGLIGRGATMIELRWRHGINARAQAHGDGPGYSQAIRRPA